LIHTFSKKIYTLISTMHSSYDQGQSPSRRYLRGETASMRVRSFGIIESPLLLTTEEWVRAYVYRHRKWRGSGRTQSPLIVSAYYGCSMIIRADSRPREASFDFTIRSSFANARTLLADSIVAGVDTPETILSVRSLEAFHCECGE